MTPPRVVYVAGYGRSGSTLLDLMLGAAPGAMGTGELSWLFDGGVRGRCSCGASSIECPFWGRVLGDAGLHSEAERAEASRVTRHVEAWRSGAPGAVTSQVGARYGEVWRAILSAVAEHGGADVVVDSSKSNARTYWRAAALLRYAGVDVTLVHLVRDPRAVLWSVVGRGTNKALVAEEDPGARRRGGLRVMASWTAANAAVARIARAGDMAPIRVRYEDLVTNPHRELSRLEAPCGIEIARVQAALAAGEFLPTGHGVGGNRLRAGGPVPLRLDDEWRRRLPPSLRALSLLGLPLALRYGYRLTDYSAPPDEKGSPSV